MFPPLIFGSDIKTLVFVNLLIASGAIYVFSALWGFRHWKIRAARPFALLMLAAGIYTIGYYFLIHSNSFEEVLFWLRFEYLGLPLLPPLWLAFVIIFTDRDRYIKPIIWPLFFVIPVISIFLVYYGPYQHIYYSAMAWKRVNGFAAADFSIGPWYVLQFVYSNLVILSASIMLITAMFKANNFQRKRYGALLAGASLPWVTYVLYLAGLTPDGRDVGPFALVFTAIVVVYQLYQLKIFNILPVARARVFQAINSGIIVLETNQRIVDINPQALKILNVSSSPVGDSILPYFDNWGEDFLRLLNGHIQNMEICISQPENGVKWYEVWQNQLPGKRGKDCGCLLILKDITSRKESEDALTRERILLRTLIDNLPVAVFVKDLHARKLLSNKTDLHNMGFSMEAQVIGKTDFEIFSEPVAKGYYKDDMNVIESGQAVLDREEMLPGLGNQENRWVLTSKVPLHDETGRLMGLVGISRDITERKHMQQELTTSEERFRTLAESTSAAVFIFQGSKYLYLNPASEKLTGYSSAELLEMNFWDIVHPEHRDMVKTRGISRQNGKKEAMRYEFKIIRKDGSIRWVDHSAAITIFRGKKATIGTSFDITERKVAEESLRRSEIRYRKIFENSNIGILQMRPNGEMVAANSAFARLLGYCSTERMLEAKDRILNQLFSNPNDRNQFLNTLEGKDFIRNFEFESSRINGSKIWVMANAWKSNTTENGNFIIEGFFLNITDQKRSHEYQKEMEVARQSSEAKNQFLANMSHEIRTPVTGIMGMAEILSQTPLSPDQRDYLGTIRDSSQVLLQLINEVLDISKIEAGRMELLTETFRLDDMLTSLKNLFEPMATKNLLTLHIFKEEGTPSHLKGDRKRIEQILMNLLSNAIKFTPKGVVSLQVSATETGNDHMEFQFNVRDTGPGISQEDRKKLFKKFSQLDNSLTRANDGSGLGLYICKELVRLMHGKIGLESTPGKGSTFWFIIPAEVTQCENQAIATPKPTNGKQISDMNVLVVDDKLVNQKVLKLMLQGEGCQVDLAVNGQEALEKFDSGKHQIVFMDIMMPVMDGVTAMKALREQQQKTLPIIALTANAMEGDAENYISSGFSDYLSKPVSQEEIRQMLHKWAGKRIDPCLS
jgi:PAS domain S-box-containing protein